MPWSGVSHSFGTKCIHSFFYAESKLSSPSAEETAAVCSSSVETFSRCCQSNLPRLQSLQCCTWHHSTQKNQACAFIPCFLSVSPLQLVDIGIHPDCKGAFTAVSHSVFAQEEKTGLSFPHCLPPCLFPSPTESSSCSTPNIVPPSGTWFANSPSQCLAT